MHSKSPPILHQYHVTIQMEWCHRPTANGRKLPESFVGHTFGALCSQCSWYGQHGHDLDGIAWENCKVWMVLEHFGGGLMRVCADQRKGTHFIARVVDAALRDILG